MANPEREQQSAQAQAQSIVCPDCLRRSCNPDDVVNRYCGACNAFHDELLARPVRTLDALVQQFYWACFRANVGSDAHAFIEFNGVMSKYVQLLHGAAKQGVHARYVSEHSGAALPCETHDMAYLGEKLRCIFAPFIDANPQARDVLRKALFGEGE